MWILNFLIGLGTGVLSGFGIGGGSLLILYLTSFTQTNQYAAGGINLLYFVFCAPAALVSHIKNKLVEKKAAIVCTIAGVLTSVGAAFLAAAIDVSLLRRIFGAFLLYIGVREIFCKKEKKEQKSEPTGNASSPSSATRR